MKIICDSCGAKYTVSDDKVQGKTVKVKCRKCGAVIVVSSSGEVSTTGGPAAEQETASGPGEGYTVAVADGDQRSMTMEDIVNAYNDGVIDADTFVWAEGMDDWLPLRDVDAIVDALHAAAGPAEAEAAEPGQEDLGATIAMVDGAAPGMAAAAAAPAASPFETAMAAAGASSPSGASAAPTGGSDPGFAAAAAANPGGSTGFSSGPGEENSAIFSLNMLTSKVGQGDEAAPTPGGNFSEDEDSGLIDLKALAAGISTDAALAAPLDVAGGGGGVFPLGAPAPAPAPMPVVDEAPAKGGANKLLLAALATAVVVLGAVVVFMLAKGDGTPPTPSATAPVAAPTPTPTPTETPTEVASAEPSASASASASATSKVAARAPRTTGGSKPKTGGTTGGSKPKTGGSKPKTGGGGKCGCAADDLMCHMRCSQKK